MESNMFCYQCQETAGCTGCTRVGVCGKQPEVAALQDLLVYVTKGMSAVTTQLRAEGTPVDPETNHWVTLNLFLTITNANFDGPALRARVQDTLDRKAVLLAQVQDPSCLPEAAHWTGPQAVFADKAARVGVLSTQDEDVRSLRELITYGLKGLAAYTKHANALGQEDPDLDAFLQRALAATLDHRLTQEELVALALETGQYGVTGMALLDRANTTAYGHPEITKVSLGVGTRPGILVSGHDLRDLEMLLEQTQGTGVDVYTHSEMLPAHAYPAFRKYPNFIGNYGNAWWQQKEEFEAFQGPILMTTNCIVPPKDSYKDRLYTTGAAGWPGCRHIPGDIGQEKDFSPLIAQAKTCPPPKALEQGELVTGFAHHQVLALADQIVAAVQRGAIRKFVVMAGCDGRAKSRNYYTDFAKALPHDAVILTAGCAKYKYNKLDLGDINGIPRVLDAVDIAQNIVGAFWQPKLVIVDPDTLATLPRRHYINGLAEAVKASLLADPELFAIFEKGDVDARIGEIIYRSLRFKKNIVEQDEQEHGMRKALNFGHTIGHGIEAVKGIKGRRTVGLFHGECVALGMLPMIESKALQKRVRAVYRRIGLPTRTTYNKEKVLAEMLHDKKAQGGQITVIKVPGLGCWRAETIPVEGLRPLLGVEE